MDNTSSQDAEVFSNSRLDKHGLKDISSLISPEQSEAKLQ